MLRWGAFITHLDDGGGGRMSGDDKAGDGRGNVQGKYSSMKSDITNWELYV